MMRIMRETSQQNRIDIKQGYVYVVRIHPSLSGLKRHRPALVIQNNKLNAAIESFIVVPITTRTIQDISDYEVPIFEPFLNEPSFLIPFMVTTAKRNRFEKELGRIRPETFRQTLIALERVTFWQ